MLVVISYRPHHSRPHVPHEELVHEAARILHRLNYKICVAAPIASQFSPLDPYVLHLPGRKQRALLHRIRSEADVHIFSRDGIDEARHLICCFQRREINPADYPMIFLGYNSLDQRWLAELLEMPDARNIHCLEPCSARTELPGLVARLPRKKIVTPLSAASAFQPVP